MEFTELIPWDKYKINTIQLHPPLASQPLLPLEENGTRSERIQTTTIWDTYLAPTLAIHSQLYKNPKAKQSKSNFCVCQFFIYSQSLLKTYQADAMWVYATMKSWELPEGAQLTMEPEGPTQQNHKHVFTSLLSYLGPVSV